MDRLCIRDMVEEKHDLNNFDTSMTSTEGQTCFQVITQMMSHYGVEYLTVVEEATTSEINRSSRFPSILPGGMGWRQDLLVEELTQCLDALGVFQSR